MCHGLLAKPCPEEALTRVEARLDKPFDRLTALSSVEGPAVAHFQSAPTSFQTELSRTHPTGRKKKPLA